MIGRVRTLPWFMGLHLARHAAIGTLILCPAFIIFSMGYPWVAVAYLLVSALIQDPEDDMPQPDPFPESTAKFEKIRKASWILVLATCAVLSALEGIEFLASMCAAFCFLLLLLTPLAVVGCSAATLIHEWKKRYSIVRAPGFRLLAVLQVLHPMFASRVVEPYLADALPDFYNLQQTAGKWQLRMASFWLRVGLLGVVFKGFLAAARPLVRAFFFLDTNDSEEK